MTERELGRSNIMIILRLISLALIISGGITCILGNWHLSSFFWCLATISLSLILLIKDGENVKNRGR